MRLRGGVAILALLLGTLPATVRAAAEHVGRVALPTGVAVPGARVTATQGQQTVTTSTDAQGLYRFPSLADGRWQLRVEMIGMATQTREIVVGAEPSSASWEVTLLPFEEITRGMTIPPPAPPPDPSRRLARSGSDNGRGGGATPAANPFQRAGVAPTPPPPGAAAAAAAAAAALAGRAGGPGAGPMPPPPDADASGDSLLVSGTVNSGAAPQPSVGNVARATGVRLFRGQVSVSITNSAFDARPYSLTGLPQQRPDTGTVNLTGSFSRPIRIPGLMNTARTVNVSYTRNARDAAETRSQRMPTLLQRSGNFSQTVDSLGRPVQIVDPLTGLPFEGNVVPAHRISPQAAALLRYYPDPDPIATGAYNYQIAALSATDSHSVNVQMPTVYSNNTNQVGFTTGYNRSSNESTSLFGFDSAGRGSGVNVNLNWMRRWLPSNQIVRMRHTYTRQTNTTSPHFANLTNVSGEAGIDGNNQDPVNWGPPSLSFASNIAGLSDSQYSSNLTQSHAFGADTARTVGRHNMNFGGNVRYQMLDLVSQQNARGSFTFNGAWSGHDFADFLLGIPNTSSIAFGNADKGFRAWTYDAYWNDDFRVGQNVTLNFGVRWEFEAPVTERFGRLVNLDVADDFSAAAPVIADTGIGPITGRTYPDSLVRSSPWGIQPRVGVAWRPIPTSSVVLRAGYGIYRSTSVYQSIAQQMAQQPPLSRTFNVTNTPETPLTLANGFIAPISTTTNTVAYDPDFEVGTVHRWQASAQRDLPGGLTAVLTYLAGRGINLPQSFIPNTYPAGAPNPCPACPSGFVYTTSGGTSLQNAGQFELRRRLSSGLTWSTTYTHTRATDNASSFGGPGGGIAQNWLDLEAERSTSSSERRHEFRVTAQYSTGQGLAGGALTPGLRAALLRGWTLTPNLTISSGAPYTPVYSVTSVAGVTGTVRADLTGEPIDAAPDGYYANPLAFAPPAPGAWGNAPRNSIRGPGQFLFNASLSRNFIVNNRFQLNWNIQASNILNRVTYATIDTTVGSSQFGLPTAPNQMRRITTSMRVGF